MAKSGHHFPATAGFKNSTGKMQSVSGYTRAVPKKSIGGPMRPAMTSGPKMIPRVQPAAIPAPRAMMGPPVRQAPIIRNTQPVRPGGALAYAEGGMVGGQTRGPVKSESIGDQGRATVGRGKPAYTEADSESGGTSALRTGYKKGGSIKKGAPPFTKAPLFGKK
jgi:hypothetical protein